MQSFFGVRRWAGHYVRPVFKAPFHILFAPIILSGNVSVLSEVFQPSGVYRLLETDSAFQVHSPVHIALGLKPQDTFQIVPSDRRIPQ